MIVLTLSKLFDEIYSKGKILGVMVKTCLFFLYWDIYRAFWADPFSSLSILSFPLSHKHSQCPSLNTAQ